MKKKVLFLVDTLEVGGAEKSLLEILQRFRQTEAVVCSIYTGDALKNAYQTNGIRVLSLGLKGKYHYLRAVRKVLAVIRAEKPDLIHTTLARSHFVGRTAGRLAGVPVISSFVSESYSEQRFQQIPFSRKWKLRATQLLDRTTAKWASHFFANSESVKRSACKKLNLPPGKVSVIYRGRDATRFFNEDQHQNLSLRHSLSLSEKVPVIVNVGRLVPSKAQKELIQAIPAVLKHFPVRVLVVGEGPARPDLLKLIDELHLGESVALLGHREDVPELLQIADLFVFPSHYEGHPGALVEAMFAGLPIIASDTTVHREMIDHGQTGLLVGIHPEAIADAILLMFQNPEQAVSMAERARSKALKQYDINHIANRHEELYNHLLNPHQ